MPFTRSITIDYTQVPSTQTDFPVLVNITNPQLKTVANGGHVQRSDGFDIGFYSDAAVTTKLKWEMDFYDGTNGIVTAWVKIASISNSAYTVFYMGYGDTTITTDQSDPVNVWSNNFISVYHLGNGTVLSVLDSRAANNGTNSGATATAGQIDGAGNFVSASSQNIALPASINSLTCTAWINGTSFPNALNCVVMKNGPGVQGLILFYISNAPVLTAQFGNTAATGTTLLSTSRWYHVAGTTDVSGNVDSYINGVLEKHSAVNTGTWVGTNTTEIGGDPSVGGRFFNGVIDEVQLSSVQRSADWIACQYRNQKTPSNFLVVSPELSLSPVGLYTPAVIIGTQTNADNFNRANEDPLAGNWTSDAVGVPHFKITTNVVVLGVNTNTDTNSIWNSWSHGSDQYSQVAVTASGTSAGSGFGVCVRHNPTLSIVTMYRLVMDAGGNIELAKFVTGAFTQLATRTVTYSAGTKLGLSVQGSTLRIWYGGVQQGANVTDSAIASGVPGISYSSSIAGTSIDNWDAGVP